MRTTTISFPNGNRARAVYVPIGANGAAIVEALELPPPRALLLLHGGAAGMSETKVARLCALLVEGVARVVAEEGITVVDGGTQAGVMGMMGEGRARVGGGAPLVGVCPAALVAWPGGPNDPGRVPLEPHHTHFALTSGDRWGAETEVLFALAAALGEGVPSLALLANGGAVAREEVRHNARQGREIVVIRGSGRLADAIAAAVQGETEPDDDLASIVREGRITLFDITEGPDALAALIWEKLCHSPPGSFKPPGRSGEV